MATEPPIDRRAAIIQTATELFAEHGYQAVGMRAVADAVGIRASSLYHHFPSKVQLLYAVCEVATTAFISVQQPVLEQPGSARHRLEQVMRAHILYFHEHRLEENVGLRELAELRAQAPTLFEGIQDVRRGYQHAIQEVIEAGVREGEFAVEDSAMATLALLGLVNSINFWFQDDGPASIEKVADAYVQMGVGRLLGATAAPGPGGAVRPPVRRRSRAARA
ncbi:MAG TPA: TetR/AcrR family transcriptional regulator [Solirubrobacteraceae bacterium]|nr:TetR/AcrR family transcriptional regulator [Solirubrobacteraceae bacterium]